MADGVGIALQQAELERAAATARKVVVHADRMLEALDIPPLPAGSSGPASTMAVLAAELTAAEAVLRAMATQLKREHEDLADRLEAVVGMGDGLVADTTEVARQPGAPG